MTPYEKGLWNSLYGKMGRSIRDSYIRDYDYIPLMTSRGESIWPLKPKVTVPALDVPPPPVEPTPEPESASVQVLRGLLVERRGELKRVEDAKKSRVAQAEEAEKRAADLRERIAGDDRHIAAADDAIAAILADIATLGGRPE